MSIMLDKTKEEMNSSEKIHFELMKIMVESKGYSLDDTRSTWNLTKDSNLFKAAAKMQEIFDIKFKKLKDVMEEEIKNAK